MYDNTADADEMDNHLEREEVQEAIEHGYGDSERFSETLTQKTLYYAVRLSDNSIFRISASHHSIIRLLLGVIQPLLIVVVIAVVLSAILSRKVAKSITYPLNNIDLDNVDSLENIQIYDELSPLFSKIRKQQKTISSQIAEAEKSREEFKLITENMSEGFLVIDKGTILLMYNSAALHLLNVNSVKSGESVLALNRSNEFRKLIDDVLSGEHAECELKIGENVYKLIANPAMESSNVIGAVIVILDITEQNEREKLRREFTANVSHELKTPLTSISGFAELMKSGNVSKNEVVDFSKTIYDETQRLIILVNDIIRHSELDERKSTDELEMVDLYDLSSDTLKHLKPQADSKNISLSLSGEHVSVKGMRSILEEVVFNLCDNAIKYNKKGGRVDVTVEDTGENSAVLTVSDNGIGIAPIHQNRVFERFYRVDKSHSKAIGGTGLGLSIVKHGVMYHNAELSLKSEEGKGTKIRITFKKDCID